MADVHQNEDSPSLDPILRWPTPGSKTWVGKLLQSAHHDENIVVVIAVGSAVRPNVASVDLDLVILAEEARKIDLRPPLEIDLRSYPFDQVNSLIARGTDLLGWSIKYGKVLYQRNAAWDAIIHDWQNRVPLPTPEVATTRATDALRRLTNMIDIGDYDAAYEQAISYVTHLSRAELIKRNIYPASRPELPGQLRDAGVQALAEVLESLIDRAVQSNDELISLVERVQSH